MNRGPQPSACLTHKAASLQRSSGTSAKGAFWEIPYLLLTMVGTYYLLVL